MPWGTELKKLSEKVSEGHVQYAIIEKKWRREQRKHTPEHFLSLALFSIILHFANETSEHQSRKTAKRQILQNSKNLS